MKRYIFALVAVFIGSLIICSCEKDPVIGDGTVSFKYNSLNVSVGQSVGNPYVINDSKVSELMFSNDNKSACVLVVGEVENTVIVTGKSAGTATISCFDNSKDGSKSCLGGFTVHVK